MLKNLARLFLSLLFLVAVSVSSLWAQPSPTITGPQLLCDGECGDYTFNPGSTSAGAITWSVNPPFAANIISPVNGLTVTACSFGIPFSLTAVAVTPNGTTATASIYVSVPSDFLQISGQSLICLGECAIYTTSGNLFNSQWFVSDNAHLITNPSQQTVTICALAPGQINIDVSGYNNSGCPAFGSLTVQSVGAPDIVSLSAVCPPDSASVCEQVCAFTTVTYEATNVPPNTTVNWQVQGAQGYDVNGNQITVEWGAPGQGQVSASIGSPNAADHIQVFCGQQALDPSQPGGILTATGYVQIHGGTAPYNVALSGSNGPVVSGTTGGLELFPFLPPDVYVVTISDAAGNTTTCGFEITVNDSACWLNAYPAELVNPSNPNACDGFLALTAFGGIPPYTFQWSNGSTTGNLSDACCGTYFVSVTDAEGCFTSLTVTLQCNGNCPNTDALCVNILAQPEAAIGSLPAAVNGVVDVCQGQTVYFENQSLNATNYAWDFGDFSTSAQFEPSHTFVTPGTYTVALIARNACFCADTAFLTVNVTAALTPEILCTGAICEGETITYSTEADCSTFLWAITGGGTILGGGGPNDNYITVEWAAGPEGTVSLDVSGCSSNYCTFPNATPIPILSDAVEIRGPNKVCEGSTEEYFLPPYQGTEINWTVLGSGFIEEGQGTNRILVHWFGDANIGNPQRVIVEFENCYLGCGGRDTLLVSIVPQFYLTGPNEVCESATAAYQSRNAINNSLMLCNWQVLNSNGEVVASSPAATNTFNVLWNYPPGSYRVRATPASAAGFCNDEYQVFIRIIASPPPPTAITGQMEICPGEPYAYLANGQVPNDFTWSVAGGTPALPSGNPVNITWGPAPPWSVSVAQVATTGLGCTGDPITLNVGPLPPFTITGSTPLCRETSGIYSTGLIQGVDYQWSISPSGAGSITSGQGTASIGIQWHEAGSATVRLTICGVTQSFSVTVWPLPEPFVPDAMLCQGETITMSTTAAFSNYVWENEFGGVVSTLPNPDLGGGFYEVEVTDVNGCRGDTTFEISEFPLPNLSISTPAYLVCPSGPLTTLHATESDPPYHYAWYQNSAPVGTNSPTHAAAGAGLYEVVATDVNGCTAQTFINLIDCASVGGTCVNGYCFTGGGPPAPGCLSNGNIDFTYNTTADCFTLGFINNSIDFVPGSMQWFFGNGNTSTLDNPPPQTYSGAGYYTALLIGLVNSSTGGPPCQDWTFLDVLIPVEADFVANPACPGQPTEFTDESVFISPAAITGWSWDFGDPASGAANTSTAQDPSHVYAAPGSYTVTLTITESGGCQTSVQKTITVASPPTVSFTPPTLSCEGLSLPFTAATSADATSFYWNFGDPASGGANTSQVANPYHEFDAAGVYPVTLTAENIYGCAADFSQNFSVTANPFSGNITMIPPPPLCEGDASNFFAPPGGTVWLWSTGDLAASISSSTAGVYSVTVSNAQGCTYAPPPAILDINAEPNGIIKAVEYNEFGQPVAFFENSHSVCNGEDVSLLVLGSLSYSYVWSNGEPGNEISFTDDKGNLLPVGTHVFSVTVTDNATGCTSEEGPFTITVHPKPAVQIASVPGGFICENTSVVLSVNSPQPGVTYVWNTGELSTNITVVAGGTYFATAVNAFGCRGESNDIVIQNAPDISQIPAGCHTRCQPDALCLPDMPNIAGYQWMLNGNPIAPPNGTAAEPVFTLSGDYTVVLTDIYGCTSESDVLSLDLYTGFGDILGHVWSDVDNNGVIGPPDTLMSGIGVILTSAGTPLDTLLSNANGSYIFLDILSTDYTVILDTANLPPGWSALQVEAGLTLSGCDDEATADWLLTIGCVPNSSALTLEACAGDSALYAGTPVPAGTSQPFTFTNQAGCDSTVMVTVLELPDNSAAITLSACEGDSALYAGTPVPAGTTQIVTLTAFNGCDSLVAVTVTEIPASTNTVTLSACEGDSALYEGVLVPAGTTQTVTLTAFNGCDSLVAVTVTEIPASTGAVTLFACEGDSALYAGTPVPAGTTQVFPLTAANGCDSLVTVSVTPLPHVMNIVNGAACENGFFEYLGEQIPPGGSMIFTFINPSGCTDTTIVNVAELASSASSEQLSACPGDTVYYLNVPLEAGQTAVVTLSNWLDCDSVVTVTVAELPAGYIVVDGVACAGSFMEYNGQQIAAGSSAVFYEINTFGCMDTVLVAVDVLPVDTVALTLQACENETVSYHGQPLSPGQDTSFTFPNQFNCDSVVMVSVSSFPASSFDLAAETTCWNDASGAVHITNVQGGTPPILFSMDKTAWQPAADFTQLTAGEYIVYSKDGNDCEQAESIIVPEIPPVTIVAMNQTLACRDSVLLKPMVVSQLPFTWQWQNGSTDSVLWVNLPGVYAFTIENACEKAAGSIEVALEDNGPVSLIYMPNSFSPNDDGFNDCYRGYINPDVELLEYTLKIFDRWGNHLFETHDIEGCWDGLFREKPMDPAVVVYFITMQVRNCEGEVEDVFREGGIHIMR